MSPQAGERRLLAEGVLESGGVFCAAGTVAEEEVPDGDGRKDEPAREDEGQYFGNDLEDEEDGDDCGNCFDDVHDFIVNESASPHHRGFP